MTRVPDYGNADNMSRGTPLRAWGVYKRLVGYALRYRFRLAMVLLFSTVVAFSFVTVILGVGTGLSLIYLEEGQVDAKVAEYSEILRKYTENSAGETRFWAPSDIEGRLERLVDSVRENKTRGLAYLSAFLVAVTVLAGLARFVQEAFAGSIGADISIRLNREMFGNVLRQSHRFFEGHKTGEIIARFTNDAFMVNRGLSAVFVKLFREPIKAVMFFVAALSISWELTLVVVLVLPAVGYVIYKVGRQVKKSAQRSLQKIAAMATVVEETVSGIAIVKGFRMEEYEQQRIHSESGKLRRNLVRMAQMDAAIGPVTELIMVLGVVALIFLSQRQIQPNGPLNPFELAQLFAFLAAMLDPMRKLSAVNNMVQTSVASAERVFEFIDMQPDVRDRPGAVAIGPLRRALQFDNVRFSYNGKDEVLRGVSFEIKHGEMVALVGFSGAGKSTIAKLIPRFYDVLGGRVLVDGFDIRDVTLESLRNQIGIVTQDNILFHDTVEGNLTYGSGKYTREDVERAAKAAHAHEFIMRLSKGYEEVLGEGGGTLSGGQRQRLAIARAIIKNPSILILDEATSSLDAESERAIQQAMAEFVVGRTTLVIAHRMTTIRRADRILVLDEGRIVEEGTHEELIAQRGLYKRLYDVQFAPGKDHDAA